MRILVLASFLPASPSVPGSPRLFQLCRHLSQRHELVLLVKHAPPEQRAHFAADPATRGVFARVAYLPPVPRPTWLRQQAHRLRLASHMRTDVRHPAYHRGVLRTVEAALGRLGDDALVYADGLEMTQYVAGIPPRRAIVDLHDCLSYLAGQRARMAPRRRERLGLWLERHSLARWERGLGRRFRAVVFNSEVDAAIYRRMAPQAGTCVISNGVDTDYYARSRPREERPVLVFTGVMSYDPNEDAAIHFCRAILPRVREAVPDAEFRIVGPDPSPALRAAAEAPGVRVLGRVADIRPHLDAAAVFVCPLRYGSGMKNKVLTALAMSLPVVATSAALASIEVQPGVDVLAADAPAEFARHVVRLLADRGAAARLAARGRRLAEERYSWRQRGEQLEALVAGTPQPALVPA